MAERTAIEWTDATWTPIRARNKATGKIGWHCEHASQGCVHCYAESMNGRLGTGLAFKPGHRKDVEIFLDEKMLLAPLRMKTPRMIFVCSMTDLFADFVSDEWINRIFAVIAACPQHRFQVLTKRAVRMRAYCTGVRIESGRPLPNVWLGVSVEDQPNAHERIRHLVATPAAVRYLSVEPMLGPIILPEEFLALGKRAWVICGGESGPKARPMHPNWARDLRDQCAAAGVPFHFKQWGAWLPWEPDVAPMWLSQSARFEDRHSLFPSDFDKAPDWDDGLGYVAEDGHAVFQRVGKKAAGRLLDGVEWNQFPEALT